MRTLRCLIALSSSLAIVSCGGGNSTPTGPTQTATTPASGTPAATAGATINGQLSSGTAATGSAIGSASSRSTPVATVTVVGTNVSTTTDGTGSFTLTGVPAGTVQLRFSGPGTDATVQVGEVRAGDTLTLTFAVSGNQAALLGDSRNPGAAAAPINGIITSLTGTRDSFEFRVNGERIRGDALTYFFGHPNRTPESIFAIMNGLRAEVKAWPRDGFWYAERLHVNIDETTTAPPPTSPTDPTAPTPPQNESASIEGELTSISGTRPTLVLVVAGVTVRTSSSTVVQRRGDVQDLSVLRIGMTIHVVGDRRSDGSIDARRLQIKDDETGGEFEIEGPAGGLRGTCPVVSFGVNGFDIVTTASTTFTVPCAELRNGMRVRVRGVRQASGSVQATSVARP